MEGRKRKTVMTFQLSEDVVNALNKKNAITGIPKQKIVEYALRQVLAIQSNGHINMDIIIEKDLSCQS